MKRTVLLLTCLTWVACTTPPPRSEPEPPPARAITPAPTEQTVAAPALEAAPESAPDPIDSAVGATDRSEADRALDLGRKPAELLRFFGIAPGMRVADLMAGGGYTTELLARVVGSSGQVYGQNPRLILDRFAQAPWTERLQKPVMQNVVRVDAEMDAPLPAAATDLDAVLLVLAYHDTVWFKTDRARMNRAIYAALAPGGVYGIVDHSARPGDGVKQAEKLHRIEESVVVREIEAAGFVLEAKETFLAHPDDPRDWNASPSKAGEKRGTSDRFVLRFRKPKDAVRTNGAADVPQAGPDGYVQCPERRSQMCTKIYKPVCADVDTGIRCIRAPCPSIQKKTYGSDCTACADSKVIGHRPGACPEAPKGNAPSAPAGAVTE
jgi:predicted methyltransferase